MSETRKLTDAAASTAIDSVFGMSGGSLAKGKAGYGNGDFVQFIKFPTHSEFTSQGRYTGTGNYDYFHSLLIWLKEYTDGKEGCFIGTASPNSQGIAVIHIYANTSDGGIPTYSSGIYIGPTDCFVFKTSHGIFRLEKLSCAAVTS